MAVSPFSVPIKLEPSLSGGKVQEANDCATDVAEFLVRHPAKLPLQAGKRNGLNLLKVENSRPQKPESGREFLTVAPDRCGVRDNDQ